MPHERDNTGKTSPAFYLAEVFRGTGPAPAIVTAKDAVRELVQRLPVRAGRIRGEPTVTHNFRGHALANLLREIFHHLQIGMAMTIDETWTDHKTSAIHYGSGRFRRAHGRDPARRDEEISVTPRRARSVDERSTLQQQCRRRHRLLHLAPCFHLPDFLDRISSDSVNLVVHIDRHAHVIRKDMQALSNLKFAITMRCVEVSVLFGERNEIRMRIFAD